MIATAQRASFLSATTTIATEDESSGVAQLKEEVWK